MVSDTKAVKSVEEFWTCCKLAMNGWAPALTRDGLERTDILAERSHAPFDVTQISVQVKTSRNERWALNPAKIGSQRSLYEWFVLVGWNENEQTLSRLYCSSESCICWSMVGTYEMADRSHC